MLFRSGGWTSTLALLHSDGSLDTSFGTGGVATAPVSLQSVALQSDGKIIGAGAGDFGFSAVRYSATGILDTTFGANGVATTPTSFYSRPAYPVDVAVAPDGKIVLAGGGSVPQPSPNPPIVGFGLARFLAAGPQIGSFTASPNPVTAGSSVTLTAANVVALNPNSTVTQVALYLDANGDGKLDRKSVV